MKENIISKFVRDYLQYMENQKKLMFIRTNAGTHFKMYKKNNAIKTYKISLAKKGFPDYVIFFPKTTTIFVETKSTNGKLSKDQKIVKEFLEQMGYQYYVIDSIDVFLNLMKEYLGGNYAS